ncbi:MAG TPA: isoaspartyl peptidase/L-asparaginase [Alphaproteobacteria bacterium]|nr:isoaspartyl peptidase/L-asparaginase [Alphaproteobacteria bacterium]
MTGPGPVPAIAVHGGAGTVARSSLSAEQEARYHAGLAAAVKAGQIVLMQGGSALDAVTEAVVSLEDCPLFNAGHGAVFTSEGTHELDASIMDGRTLAAGAVGCTRRIRNPVRAARAVMAGGDYVFLVGEGADRFAAEEGLVLVDNAYFATEARREQWRLVRERGGTALDHDAATLFAVLPKTRPDPDNKLGTVGAVALDRDGNLAAATSTGGLTNKHAGRVGDTPIIGAGCYANNRTLAVSATGSGEVFMRLVVGHDISARMEYTGADLAASCSHIIMERLPAYGGRGGVIAVDRSGKIALPFSTEGMYRGYARGNDAPVTAIYR